MKKLTFSKTIDAPAKKVWNALWDKKSYEEWTTPFSEGSTVETDNWKQGSKVLFLDKDRMGMVSTVAENRPNEFMSFTHIGQVKNGVEDTTSDEVKKWAGATESYALSENNGKTDLKVEMDITEDYADYFTKTWPTAMEKIKEVSERN